MPECLQRAVMAAAILVVGGSPFDAIGSPEPEHAGWQLYIDNDALTNASRDHDYTGGLSLSIMGAWAKQHALSLDAIREQLDTWIGLAFDSDDSGYLRKHNMEVGITLFTPRNISEPRPILDDHPYASLLFLSNTETTAMLRSRMVFRSTLTLGLLGTAIGEQVQKGLHKVVGTENPRGWHNQISDSGELTARYSLSVQKVNWQHHFRQGSTAEIRTTVEGNIGYSTDANVTLSFRWGDIKRPWWDYSPHISEYINLGATSVVDKDSSVSEFYLWGGLNAKRRVYNVILQGQLRDSPVTFDREDLERWIGEAWLGVTRQFESGTGVSMFLRWRTSELNLPGNNSPNWAGIVISHPY